jgi:hypothetical protein
MTNHDDIEMARQKQGYIKTIKEIRANDFANNLPFLILSEKLPEGQVYREFPDGRIELQKVYSKGSEYKFKVLKVLTPEEANKVWEEYGLFER